MNTFDSLKGHQGHQTGIEKFLNTRYKKDQEFKEAVDWLIKTNLCPKDIKRVADIASSLKDGWAHLQAVYLKNGGSL